MHALSGSILFAALLLAGSAVPRAVAARDHLVMMTDFGLRDGAVCEMKGVVLGVDPELRVADLTHEIRPFDIWEAAYRLNQAMRYWPGGSVFVSVVDPGVGTGRNSVIVEVEDPTSKRRYRVVTPNNGTMTLVARDLEVLRVHEIDEARNRLPAGSAFHTFHGRDLYAFTGARLAAGQLRLEDAGRALAAGDLVQIPFDESRVAGGRATGIIPVLDVSFGNVWTNITSDQVDALGLKPGDAVLVAVERGSRGSVTRVFEGAMPFVRTFGDVAVGEPLAYVNSLDQFALALNQGSFAARHGIGSGPDWRIQVKKVPR